MKRTSRKILILASLWIWALNLVFKVELLRWGTYFSGKESKLPTWVRLEWNFPRMASSAIHSLERLSQHLPTAAHSLIIKILRFSLSLPLVATNWHGWIDHERYEVRDTRRSGGRQKNHHSNLLTMIEKRQYRPLAGAKTYGHLNNSYGCGLTDENGTPMEKAWFMPFRATLFWNLLTNLKRWERLQESIL